MESNDSSCPELQKRLQSIQSRLHTLGVAGAVGFEGLVVVNKMADRRCNVYWAV